MYVLFETPAGFALFKVLKEGKLKDLDTLHENFETLEKTNEIIKLAAFKKFDDTKQAMKSVEKLLKGDMSKTLKKFLEKNIVQKGIEDALLVADKKLGKTISEKLGIDYKTSDKSREIMRCIRFQQSSLLQNIEEAELKQMALGLSHTMSRYKLAFSTERVDSMII